MEGVVTFTIATDKISAEQITRLDAEVLALGLKTTLPQTEGGDMPLPAGTYGAVIQIGDQMEQVKPYYRSLVALMILCPVFSTLRQNWQPIHNTDAILGDVQNMLNRLPDGNVCSNEWSNSITSLNPRFVRKTKDHVVVTLNSGGINPAWGYFLFPDKRETLSSPLGIRILGKHSPGIFRYETIE